MNYELADGSCSNYYKIGDVFKYSDDTTEREKCSTFKMGQTLKFLRDDHSPCPEFVNNLGERDCEEWSLLVPVRHKDDYGNPTKGFTKDDLIPGEHIVVTQNGEEWLVLGGAVLQEIGTNEWENLNDYAPDMKHQRENDYNIEEVYTFSISDIYFDIESSKYRTLVWERKPEKKEWYEDIPEGGVLCKVWDYEGEWSVTTVVRYTKDRYPYRTTTSAGWMNAVPLTKEEIQVFLNNAPEEE